MFLQNNKFLGSMKIGTKLNFGFGILVFLVLLVIGLSYLSSAPAISNINQTKNVRVPAGLAATRAQTDLLRMLASIRAYLILGKPEFRTEYNQARQDFETDLTKLKSLTRIEESRFAELDQVFKKWLVLPDKIFALYGDLLANQPAQRIMSQQAEFNIPIILAEIDRMIKFQAQREPSAQNTNQLILMSNFQNSYALMVAQLRSYVTTGNTAFKFEYKINQQTNETNWQNLLAQREFLLADQQANLDKISQLRDSFSPLPQQIFEVLEGEHAREDLFLFRTQLMPLGEQMSKILDEMALEQQRLLEVELQNSSDGLSMAQWQTLGGGLFAVIFGLGLAFTFRQAIAGPVTRLTESAAQIAAGNLMVEAPVESSDEIGTLAKVFNGMTAQLRELIYSLEQRVIDLKQAEEVLANERNLLRTLIDNLPDFVYVKDNQSRFLLVNTAVIRHMGKTTAADVIGKTDFDFHAESFAKLYYADEQALIQSGQTLFNKEELTVESDGYNRWLLSSKIVLRDKDNKINGFVGIGRDITHQKQTEEELRQYRNHLEELVTARTHQLEVIANLSSQFNAMLDVDQILGALINQLKQDFSYYHTHIYLLDKAGRYLTMVAGTGEIGATMKAQKYQVALDLEKSLVAQSVRGRQVVRVDDVRQVEDWQANPFLPDTRSEIAVPIVAAGEVVGVLDVQSDQVDGLDDGDANLLRSLAGHVAVALTNARLFKETMQAKEEAEVAKEKSEVANHAKSEFLSSMSHELRTPLNGILGYAQILKRKKDLDISVQNGLNIIHQSGNHLLTLINDILDLSKIEARKMEINPTALNLPTFLEGVVGIIYMRAQEKKISFHYEAQNLPLAVLADEKRLRQILLNLLGNAIKFTAEGAVTLRVMGIRNQELGIRSRESSIPNSQFLIPIRFEVEDSGVGIAPENIAKIFEPFEQVGEVKQRNEGTGLGLAITRQLVQLMGSELHVKSELGKGSTFWFEIDLFAASLQETMQTKSAQRQIIGYHGARRKVLAVDDKLDNRAVLTGLLVPFGFEVTEAEDGLQALKQLQALQPDLIITDLVMPVMTGFEFMEHVRATPELAEVKIIVSSASAIDMHDQHSTIAHSDGFISKPMDINRLLELIQQCLGLQWEYEGSALPPVEPTEGELVLPPLEELQTLAALVKGGNMRKVRQHIQHIAELGVPYKPFAEQIDALAVGYEVNKLRDLVQEYLEKRVSS